jgi:small multidrug resistance pump
MKPPPTIDERLREVFVVTPGAHDALADLAAAAGSSIEERLRAQARRRRAWTAYPWLLLAIVAGATGTSALSQSAAFTRSGPVIVMALAYLICFLAMARALRTIPIGIAYAVWSGVGIALITLVGWRMFGQRLSAGELAGIGLILSGIVVIQIFSKTKAH